jgi:signal transduction histidine kinase
MIFKLPGSTSRQIGLNVLFAGFWMIAAPIHRLSQQDRGMAAQIGLVARMDLALPRDQRAQALAAASNPKLRIKRQSAAPDFGDFVAPNPLLVETIREEINNSAIDVLAGPVDQTPTESSRKAPQPLQIAVKIAEGDWLLFRVSSQPHNGPWTAYSVPAAAILLVGVPLVAITLWAARRVTSPLTRLADATARISPAGVDVAIPEEGTDEIRQVARGFNAILSRLQKFVTDRTNMLAAISHDLRTPLTRLRLRAEMLPDESLRAKMLKDIRAMDVMIASSLAYITQERSVEPMENIDLAALLQTLSDDFSDAGFDVAYVGPLHCAAVCRPQALERALNNLVDNAIKFGESATLVLDSAGESLVVDVEDDGPGIPDREKDDVLKPFYRIDGARGEGGVGLGLAIANTIVQGHGGALQLLDRQPRGLCARVSLPKVHRRVAMAQVSEHPL